MGFLAQAGARIARVRKAGDHVEYLIHRVGEAGAPSTQSWRWPATRRKAGRKLVAAGCMVERYRNEIQKEIPEVNAVVGTGELERVLEAAGLSPAPKLSTSPFPILDSRPEAAAREPAGRFSENIGAEHKPGCRTICTMRIRRGCWPRRRLRLTSKSRKAAIIPARFALSRNSAGSFVRGALNR